MLVVSCEIGFFWDVLMFVVSCERIVISILFFFFFCCMMFGVVFLRETLEFSNFPMRDA